LKHCRSFRRRSETRAIRSQDRRPRAPGEPSNVEGKKNAVEDEDASDRVGACGVHAAQRIRSRPSGGAPRTARFGAWLTGDAGGRNHRNGRPRAVRCERSAGDPCGDEACSERTHVQRGKKTPSESRRAHRGWLETAWTASQPRREGYAKRSEPRQRVPSFENNESWVADIGR